MKIAIWNVNSIKARLEHVKKWLSDSQVDVLMIQELKGEAFPSEAFEALGYIAVVSSQKAYNGVATLIKKDLTGLDFEVMAERLPGDESDKQARFLDCKINGVRCVNIYLPNGNPVDSEKYPYKLSWMKRLYSYMETLRGAESDVLVALTFIWGIRMHSALKMSKISNIVFGIINAALIRKIMVFVLIIFYSRQTWLTVWKAASLMPRRALWKHHRIMFRWF